MEHRDRLARFCVESVGHLIRPWVEETVEVHHAFAKWMLSIREFIALCLGLLTLIYATMVVLTVISN